MWNTDVPLFDDENETDLINQFVELSAKYPDRHPTEITNVIFRNLRDPILRAGQAANKWSSDLEIIERIDNLKAGKNSLSPLLTFEELNARVLATIEDKEISPQEKKVRLDGYRDIAILNGWVKKAIEQTNRDARVPPQVISAIGDFHAN